MIARSQRMVAGVLLFLMATGAAATPRWHWEDDFNRREQARLVAWIEHADESLRTLIGNLPYAYDVHFHRLENRGEPVPWANTSKRGRQRAVKFHVDADYSRDEFIADWTASHELSHLMFPYLGRSSMWFAEGIASYLQYQVMYAGGTLDWPAAMRRYEERFRRAGRRSSLESLSIVELTRIVRETRAYVRLYWGGAAFFLEADRRLAESHGLRLHDVIRRYLDCCFGQGRDAMAMIRIFDRLSDSRIFSQTYAATVERRGFPDIAASLAWLRANPPAVRTAVGG